MKNKQEIKKVKGYKVFNSDFTCRDFKYEVGKTYEHKSDIELCGSGFHFCKKLADCFNYYNFDSNNKVAEILAENEIISGEDKSVTSKITIIRELTWLEVLNMVNTGKNNSGNYNSGDYNSGDCNSGNYNSGYCNSGDHNSGDCNSGNYNSGYYNSGNCNSGDHNSGYYNSGNCNSGDYTHGFFNTNPTKINLFNKSTNLTMQEFREKHYDIYNILIKNHNLVKFISLDNMTKLEKKNNSNCEVLGGYLKILDYKESCKIWWKNLNNNERKLVTTLPNFDKKIFKEITGITVKKSDIE